VVLAFARLAVGSYVLYGFGYVVPVLRRDLGLSETVAGLHAVALAIGIIASGALGERLVHRLGPGAATRMATAGLVVGSLAVAFAPHAVVSLGAALLIGACIGVFLSWVNQHLSALGGHRGRVALARANFIALLAALVAPLAIATADDLGLGGRSALLLPLVGIGLIELWLWRHPTGEATELSAGDRPHPGRAALSGGYRRAWFVLVLVIGVEFSIVFWGASLIGLRAGVGTVEATTAAAAFLLGMIVARALLAAGLGRAVPRVRLLAVALIVVVIGVLGAWTATSVTLSAVALFVAGLGIGPLYPTGVAFALSQATTHPEAAAARATLASGVAILVAPFVLGVTAERIGLVAAWPLVAALAILALAVLFLTRQASGPGAPAQAYAPPIPSEEKP
jgi:MFS family permease